MGGKVSEDISGGIISPVNVTCDNLEQSIKASCPMLVTSGGMVTDVKLDASGRTPLLQCWLHRLEC